MCICFVLTLSRYFLSLLLINTLKKGSALWKTIKRLVKNWERSVRKRAVKWNKKKRNLYSKSTAARTFKGQLAQSWVPGHPAHTMPPAQSTASGCHATSTPWAAHTLLSTGSPITAAVTSSGDSITPAPCSSGDSAFMLASGPRAGWVYKVERLKLQGTSNSISHAWDPKGNLIKDGRFRLVVLSVV